jgi:TadE-like protein
MAERNRRAGQTTIEFALAYLGVLLPLTLGLVYISQLLWIWHSVADFTRQGAGYAATHCWQSSAGNVIGFMRSNVPPMPDRDQFQSGPAQITVSYFSKDPDTGQLTSFQCDSDCSSNCVPDVVTVGVTGYEYRPFVTALGLLAVALPNFQTSVPMESAGCDPDAGACLP